MGRTAVLAHVAPCRFDASTEPLRTGRMGSSPQTKEFHMPEKSPQKPAGKKPGKSLKEKREAKREKKSTKTALGH